MVDSLLWFAQTLVAPASVLEWLKVAVSLSIVFGTVGSFFAWIMNRMLALLNLKIDTIQINQVENTDATLRAIKRVERIETTINNGLTDQTRQTREEVQDMQESLSDVREQVAEIHGWMKATHTE